MHTKTRSNLHRIREFSVLADSPEVSLRLDSLRGVSALVVFLAHGYQLLVLPVFPKYYAYAGLLAQAAVMMFFCLSGLLIGRSIVNNARVNDRFRMTQYLRSRTARILPPLAFASLLVLALSQLAPLFFPSGSIAFAASKPEFLTRDSFSAPAWEVLGTFLLVNGFFTDPVRANASLWSLSIEAWYYVVAGLLFWGGRWGKVLAIGVFALGCFLNPVFMKFSVVWLSGLAVGLLRAHIRRGTPLLLVLGAALYVVAFTRGSKYVASFASADSLAEVDMSMLHTFSISIGLAFTATMAMIIDERIRFRPYFAGCAGFSYTLYLIHFPIFLFVFGVFEKEVTASVPSAVTYTAMTALLILAIAIPTGWLLENRLRKTLDGTAKRASSAR